MSAGSAVKCSRLSTGHAGFPHKVNVIKTHGPVDQEVLVTQR